MADLFGGLIWPAIAGNVAWAFFSVFLEEVKLMPDVVVDWRIAARLASLALLAIYLMAAWKPGMPDTKFKRWYYLLDGVCAVGFVLFAIATNLDKTADNNQAAVINWSLAIIFLVIGVGHICEVWEKIESVSARRLLFGVCIVAAAIVIIVSWLGKTEIYWHRPLVMFIVLVFWLIVRHGKTQVVTPAPTKTS